ncbi:MAG TPA: THUMP domain-containing protein [Candidatus Krumholzibacteria bacterium]|nr:THUMP domain-containing protein [Candidatus Krumholzibacteria bacterium]
MFMYEARGVFFAQVAGGLEELAAAELQLLGAEQVRIVPRGIELHCDRETLYRINYRSRLVSRIIAPLARFDITSGEDLYLKTKKIDWTNLMTLDQTFAVSANVSDSVIDNSHFAALKVKDVVVDMFRARYRGKRPNIDTNEPDLGIALHIRHNKATVSLDCSGGPLHRRGYRLQAVEAPMQETLAAAILDVAEWDGKQPLYDPMCGSGTLLSEAWIKAGRLPAGVLRKKWGFMMLPDFNRNDWVKVKFTEDNKVQPVRGGLIKGSDINPDAVRMTRENNARLPGGDELRVRTSDFRDLPELSPGVIVCNPPYGVRLEKGTDMAAFMKDFGDFLKQKCKGSRAWVYVGDRELLKAVGLKAQRKVPLRNGGLDGRLVLYELH